MKKNRIIGGILAAALAIVPFTGTGIDSIDKEITKETAITANAWFWEKEKTYTPGIYYVAKTVDTLSFGNLVTYHPGTYLSVLSNGTVSNNWADVTTAIDRGDMYYVFG